MSRDMIGQSISHYKILDKLGEGGMGVVYRARDTKLDRTVALKFLPSQLGTDQNEKKRFINEAKAASALDHNNICSIYSIEETNEGNVFIVMAYYEGMSLKEKIEQGPLPLKDVVNYSFQISSGLQKAHEKGIVHRDLKPANIFITKDDQIKIIDFGLAKVVERTLLTKSGTTLGTVPYMSPEQAQGAKVDHRTDIWSLGVVIYEMITGRRPFKSEYETALVYSIINEDPEPITGLRSGVPIALENIILKCLEKDPDNRYQHINELVVDIRRVEREISSGSRGIGSETGKDMKAVSSGTRPPVRKIPAVVYGIPILLLFALLLYLFYPGTTIIAEIERSIAVLPFENMSPDPDDEYFAAVVTDDIINNLSKIADLRVISRRSSMRYKDTDKSIATIGEELHVATLLEGNVRRFGDELIVFVQLVDTRADRTIWSERYTIALADIFKLQREVAQQVTSALQAQLTSEEIERMDRSPTDNLAAYELYLMGVERWDFNREALEEAAEFFRRAIRLDPEFARAYAHLGHTYYFLIPFGEATTELAVETAHRSLEIDSTMAFGYWALGQAMMGTGRYSEVRRIFHQAIKYDPNFPWSMNDLSVIEALVGRLDESLYWSRRALEREPNDANNFFHVSVPLIGLENDDVTRRFLEIGLDMAPVYEHLPKPYHRVVRGLALLDVFNGHNETAIHRMQEALERDPDNDELLISYGTILILSRSGKAESIVENLLERRVPHSRLWHLPQSLRTQYAGILMRRGKEERAIELLRESIEYQENLIARESEDPTHRVEIAAIHNLLGNTEEVFYWLEEAYNRGYRMPRFIEFNPIFDGIREDRRYRNIIERMREDVARMRARAEFSGLPGWEEYVAMNNEK